MFTRARGGYGNEEYKTSSSDSWRNAGQRVSGADEDKGTLTAPMAIKLAAALGNTPEFWLNIQHAVELWDVRHRAYEQEAKNVRRVKPHELPLKQA